MLKSASLTGATCRIAHPSGALSLLPGATCRIAHPSGALSLLPVLVGFVLLDLQFSVQSFADHSFSFFFFWALNCIVCSSSTYPFGILKLSQHARIRRLKLYHCVNLFMWYKIKIYNVNKHTLWRKISAEQCHTKIKFYLEKTPISLSHTTPRFGFPVLQTVCLPNGVIIETHRTHKSRYLRFYRISLGWSLFISILSFTVF